MSPATPAPRLHLRGLRVALVLGAMADLSGALALLIFPAATARWLGIPVDGLVRFWPMYASVFLFVLPVFYLLGAINPLRNIVIVVGAILGRLAGAAFYGVGAVLLSHHLLFAGLSAMNLVFALYYAGALGPEGRTLLYQAMRPPPAAA